MSEIEVPVEKVQETILEEAEHAREKWISMVALSSALIAVCAAVAALLAGHRANEAMLAQIKSSDHWNYYQAKGIKSSILQSKMQLLKEMGRTPLPKDTEKVEEYKKEQEEISRQAKEEEDESKIALHSHETLAKAVTFFQVAIATSAISILVKRRRFWFLSLGFGGIGIFYFIQGLLGH